MSSNADIVFFPNSDKAAHRRMRINKAKEYGASWAPSWSEDVTHIICDRVISFEELAKFLNMDAVPVSPLLAEASSALLIPSSPQWP